MKRETRSAYRIVKGKQFGKWFRRWENNSKRDYRKTDCANRSVSGLCATMVS
jgi:hypothetical protein